MPPDVAIPARTILASFAGYRPAWLKTDVAAGLAVAAVGLPSAIAYPAIAGLPPQTGLYASIAPLVAYAIFGPSRQLIVGPDAATITVMAAVLAAMPGLEAADRPAVAAMLALVVGGFYIGARLLGLGVLSTFLSRPILVGFFAGISLSILVGQLKRITGVDIEADGLIAPLVELARKVATIHWPSLALAVVMFGVMQATRIFRLPVPGPVVVVVLAVVLSALLDFRGHGIAVVGDIPSSIPALALPSTGGAGFDQLLIGAAAIFLVSFAAGIVTARSFGERGGYPVDANREMTGFGTANIAAGLFSAFPITASDSRTAINASVGGHSQLVSLVAAGGAAHDRPLPAAGARHPADPRPRRHPDRRRAQPDRRPRAARDLAHQPDGVRLRDDRALRADQPRGAQRRPRRDRRHVCLPPAQDDVPARRAARPGARPRRLLQAPPPARRPPDPGPRHRADPGRPAVLQRRPCPGPAHGDRRCTCRRTPAGWSSTPAPSPRSTPPPLRCSRRCGPTSPAAASPSASPNCTPTCAACSTGPGSWPRSAPDMIFDDLDDALRAFEADSPKGGTP